MVYYCFIYCAFAKLHVNYHWIVLSCKYTAVLIAKIKGKTNEVDDITQNFNTTYRHMNNLFKLKFKSCQQVLLMKSNVCFKSEVVQVPGILKLNWQNSNYFKNKFLSKHLAAVVMEFLVNFSLTQSRKYELNLA